MNRLQQIISKASFSSAADKEEAIKLADTKFKFHPAQKALRQIRQRANDPGTLAQHGKSFVQGMQCAANMLSDAINKGKKDGDKSAR
jgi:hypothetical protein